MLVVVTGVLLFPARATVRQWGRKQLATHPEGSFMHNTGAAVVTVL
jgi:hypothetical protein